MKHIRAFDDKTKILIKFFDSIKHNFLEFEDNGWFWYEDLSFNIDKIPYFIFTMLNNRGLGSDINNCHIKWSGHISSDGHIEWNSRDILNNKTGIDSENILDEAYDFLTSVERINAEIGLDFSFSYINKYGEKSITIYGRIP